jgi:hypothetical protein
MSQTSFAKLVYTRHNIQPSISYSPTTHYQPSIIIHTDYTSYQPQHQRTAYPEIDTYNN